LMPVLTWSRPLKMNKRLILSLLILSGCYRVGNELEPQLNYAVQDRYLKSLPSPFAPLSSEEVAQDWGREDKIALGFARELDLYQAMNSFKRAEFLLPSSLTERKLQIDYDILLCYYFGQKFPETIHTFENTSLKFTQPTFTAYPDLLVILYDAYRHTFQDDQAERALRYMETAYPETAHKLAVSKLLIKGDIPALSELPNPEIKTLLTHYEIEKKSTATAQTLNAFIPGAGYLYVGQTQSAITAFLLNGLFIWASVYAFQHGNTAAGIILTSVEAGWYFGGIYGAGQETKYYNERVYERLATPMMNENRYFPILMLKYGF